MNAKKLFEAYTHHRRRIEDPLYAEMLLVSMLTILEMEDDIDVARRRALEAIEREAAEKWRWRMAEEARHG